jgi:hypothetical protein
LSVISAAFIAFYVAFISIDHNSSGMSSSRAYRQILLVGKNQEHGVPQLILVQHPLELLTSLDDTVAIVAIDDEDDTLRVLEVMPPERADLVLASNIPHSELDVLVLDCLDIEACSPIHQRAVYNVYGCSSTHR